MTKKKLTHSDLLADVRALVLDPRASDETKSMALSIAYELGMSQGRVAGAQSIADELKAKMDAMV